MAPIRSLDAGKIVAGAGPGDVFYDAVLRNHQRQPPIGDDSRVDDLGDVPYLLQPQLKAERLGDESQIPRHLQGVGVVDIESEVAPHLKTVSAGKLDQPKVSRRTSRMPMPEARLSMAETSSSS